nr:metallophosphoesterase [Clostridia bacterium]
MKRTIAVILCFALVAVCAPFSAAEEGDRELRFFTMSDIHYFAEASFGSMGDEVQTYFMGRNKVAPFQHPLYDAWADAVRSYAADGLKYVILPGDLTFNGEYASHLELASKLEALEEETGVQIMVINGNHDIRNSQAVTFANDTREADRWTLPQEFLEIYANLGYDVAYNTYVPVGTEVGMLSYSVRLEEGYRLIFIDAGKYSADSTEKGVDEHETGGNITPELMEWILAEIEDAKAAGEVPLGITHWNVTPQQYLQQCVLQGFVMDNHEEVADTLADAGLHFMFTGHSHDSDISSQISDNGEVMYSIMTDALSEYPHNFRLNSFTASPDGTITFLSDVLDVDCVSQVVVNGVRQPKPFKILSYQTEYGFVIEDYGMHLLEGLLPGILEGVSEAGSIVGYVEQAAGINLRSVIRNLLTSDNEIVVGLVGALGVDWLTDNIMNLIADIDSQLCEKYVNDPYELFSILNQGIHDLGETVLSDIPASKFHEEYGIGSETRPGNFSDLLMEVFIYLVNPNEYSDDDPFIQDVLQNLRSGELVYDIIDGLKKGVIYDILYEGILDSVTVRMNPFFSTDKLNTIAQLIDLSYAQFADLISEEPSFKTLIDLVLASGALSSF